MRHVCINTVCVNSIWGNIGKSNQYCSLELCVCVYLCVSRGWERKFWPGYVCRRAIRPCAQNQSVEPTESGQICNSCVRMQTHTHTDTRTQKNTHTQSQTHNAYDANKQTWIQVSFSCLSLYFPQSHKHSLPHTKFSFVPVKKQVAYSSFSSFQRGMAMCTKEAWIKADLREPYSGLICQCSAVFRGCNALTPIDCRRAEREHFKC